MVGHCSPLERLPASEAGKARARPKRRRFTRAHFPRGQRLRCNRVHRIACVWVLWISWAPAVSCASANRRRVYSAARRPLLWRSRETSIHKRPASTLCGRIVCGFAISYSCAIVPGVLISRVCRRDRECCMFSVLTRVQCEIRGENDDTGPAGNTQMYATRSCTASAGFRTFRLPRTILWSRREPSRHQDLPPPAQPMWIIAF